MNLPLFIASRLRFKPDNKRSASPGIVIATAGIAIAFVVMLLSIAIVTGFKHQIRDKITGFDSQITIIPGDGRDSIGNAIKTLTLDESLEGLLHGTLPKGVQWQLALSQPVILKTDDNFAGLLMRSLPPKTKRQFIADNITAGHYPQNLASDSTRNSIIISRTSASLLGLNPGDKVYGHFFIGSGIKTRRLTIAAIYDTHFTDYDSHIAYGGLPLLQSIAGLDSDEGTEIEISDFADDMIVPYTMQLQDAIMMDAARESINPPAVINVHQTGAMYFNWLDLLDTNVKVILALMALVSGFTLISSTFIIILERVNFIGILKTMGMTNNAVRRIFIYLAMRLVGIGLLIGNVVGIGLLLIQKYFTVIPLNPEAYYLNYVPVELNWLHVVLLNVAVIAISALMLLLPTRTICRMSPAESVRYE